MHLDLLHISGLVFWAVQVAYGQATWCGKNYRKDSPIIPPGGEYTVPEISEAPLFRFKCTPAVQPYIHKDDSLGTMLIDTEVVYAVMKGAEPIPAPFDEKTKFLVTFASNGRPLGGRFVGLGVNQRIDFPLSVKPQVQAHNITCTAKPVLHHGVFEATTTLRFLPPNPFGGSMVKTDMATGGLLVQKEGYWEPIVPFGFYVSFDNYLAKNFSGETSTLLMLRKESNAGLGFASSSVLRRLTFDSNGRSCCERVCILTSKLAMAD